MSFGRLSGRWILCTPWAVQPDIVSLDNMICLLSSLMSFLKMVSGVRLLEHWCDQQDSLAEILWFDYSVCCGAPVCFSFQCKVLPSFQKVVREHLASIWWQVYLMCFLIIRLIAPLFKKWCQFNRSYLLSESISALGDHLVFFYMTINDLFINN